MKKHRIKLSLSTAIMFLTPIFFGKAEISLAVFAAAFLHELGHIMAATYLGVELKCFSLDLLGARLHTSGRLISYKEEMLLCLAGPAVNFLTLAFIAPFIIKGYSLSSLTVCFFSASALLGIINILPIQSFDGGRVLSCLLKSFIAEERASRFTAILSFACIFCLWCISVYMLVRRGATLTLFVFSSSLFIRTFASE